jgi:hypothetical protein
MVLHQLGVLGLSGHPRSIRGVGVSPILKTKLKNISFQTIILKYSFFLNKE